MSKYRIWGDVTVSVAVVVEVEDISQLDEEERNEILYEIASEEFGGISGYVGNGGCDKLIGVTGSDSIDGGGGYPEWDHFEEIDDDN